MASFNKVIVMGNLTRDPEMRQLPGGQNLAKLGLAINRVYIVNGEKREEVCFIDVNVWGKQADTAANYLRRGAPVLIEGFLRLESWVDKNGAKQSRHSITCDQLRLVGGPSRGGQGGGQEDFGAPPEAYVDGDDHGAPSQPAQRSYNQAPRASGGYAPRDNGYAPAPAPRDDYADFGAPRAAAPRGPSHSEAPAMPDFGGNGAEDDIPF